jgi:nitrite reductase/ring-hydroxylating ferredoxin subunit
MDDSVALHASAPRPADLRRIGSHPDCWYAVAWSDDVPQGRVVRREFAGEPIALYRGAGGRIFAVEDRCAHRQVPLSMGVVAGDRLRCGYHGWTYDGASGRLIEIPYTECPRGPVGVRPYPVRECDGVVFVFPGDPRQAGEPPSGLAHFTDRGYRTRRLDRSVACHYSFCHENLFDMNHQFLHRKLMGSIRANCLGHRRGDDWCEVEYAFERPKGWGGGIGERTILSRFKPPGPDATPGQGHALMKIRTEYPYQRLRVFVGGDDPALDVWLCYTPIGREQAANRTFGYLSVKRPGFGPLLDVMWPFVSWFTEAIFREDKTIMEAEQAAHDAQGADWNREIFPAILELRDVLAECGRPI